MLNINVMIYGLMAFISMNVGAITIEDIAEKNNKIIELDQEIAIAEKNKKLIDLKNMINQPETFPLPKNRFEQRDDPIFVLSVHGVPDNPIVDVQYGEMLLQKRIGESLPGGWEVSAVGNSTVTLIKKLAKKPYLTKIVGIGHYAMSTSDEPALSRLPISVPTHTLIGQ